MPDTGNNDQKMLKLMRPFIYGTAWKKDNTTRLVQDAVLAGFRAFDTAAQPKHYREDLLGDAFRDLYDQKIISRDELFIQTKYTAKNGQDLNNMPYDMTSPLEEQVRTSIESSLHNLRPTASLESVKDAYIDCLILHAPLHTLSDTMTVWQTMESFLQSGKVRSLGISNVFFDDLYHLCKKCSTPPVVVQNRFYRTTAYDQEIRRFCEDNNIIYESFWTLTGNPHLLSSNFVRALSQAAGISKEVALYSLVIQSGVVPLNGTKNVDRMKQDLLEIEKVQKWLLANKNDWDKIFLDFQKAIAS